MFSEGWQEILMLVCVWAVSYLAGTINPATMVGKARGIDIKHEGSGNPGTTNTLRVMGVKAAAIVLAVDVLKGVIMVLLWGAIFGETAAMAAAFGVLCGHCFPFNQGFDGGKGVATAFGALTALEPALGLGCLGIVILAVLITRRVSPGSIAGAISCPVLSIWLLPEFVPLACVMAAIVIYRHKSNIIRLINHEEPPFSFKRKKEEPEENETDKEDGAR